MSRAHGEAVGSHAARARTGRFGSAVRGQALDATPPGARAGAGGRHTTGKACSAQIVFPAGM